jgi:hypothetical protein
VCDTTAKGGAVQLLGAEVMVLCAREIYAERLAGFHLLVHAIHPTGFTWCSASYLLDA